MNKFLGKQIDTNTANDLIRTHNQNDTYVETVNIRSFDRVLEVCIIYPFDK